LLKTSKIDVNVGEYGMGEVNIYKNKKVKKDDE
jgi:hypothetical protein